MYKSIRVFYEGRMLTYGFPVKVRRLDRTVVNHKYIFALFSCIVAQHKQTNKMCQQRETLLYLSLQMCGLPHRLSLGCPPLGSSAAARLLLGFFPQQVVVQTGNVRTDMLMLYTCVISLYHILCPCPGMLSGQRFQPTWNTWNASQTRKLHSSKGWKMRRFSWQESLTVSLHEVSLSFLTFFPILCPRRGRRHIRCSMQSTLCLVVMNLVSHASQIPKLTWQFSRLHLQCWRLQRKQTHSTASKIFSIPYLFLSKLNGKLKMCHNHDRRHKQSG